MNPLITRRVSNVEGVTAYHTWCPACDDVHVFRTPTWGFDGDMEAPTFEGSMLVQKGASDICHSFLRKGVWDFLPDSTHRLAGDSAPMVPLPDWLAGDAS